MGGRRSAIPPLLGHTVAVTGDRRSDELAAQLRSLGADVLHGRCSGCGRRPPATPGCGPPRPP